jgi:SynChlorMet cassette radical SAM/SPASM protein ScmF
MSPEAIPPIHALYVNLTDRCNLRCRHCWLSAEIPGSSGQEEADMRGGSGSPLSLAIMREVISQAKPLGLHTVKLTGGEPFVRTDIMNFVSLFHEEGLNVDIETNGTLIDGPRARSLRRLGVRGVSVSLDSSDPRGHDRFRGMKGAFASAINGIRHLVEGEVPTQIIMSLYRGNADQIEPLARLSVDLGVRLLKINPVLPVGRGHDLYGSLETLSVEELIESLRWVGEELQPRTPIPIYFSLPVAFQSIREIIGGKCPECTVLNILGIVENGDISFCGIQRVAQDLVMGNVRRDRLEDIWFHHPLLKRMRETIPDRLEGICGQCFFKRMCLGSCLACTYYLEKRLTAPYWFCQEAFEKGLFPKTRYVGGQA